MFRMSFDQELFGNIKEHSLFVFIRGMYRAYVCNLYSCVCMLIHAYVSMFFSSYGCMIQPVYACRDPTYAYVDLCAHASTQKALFSLFSLLFHIFANPTLIFMLSFHLFCKSCLCSQVGEALTILLRGIGPSILR